jgi:hypothetical protein
MVCLGNYAILDGFFSLLCSLQRRLSDNSKSARIISMTRLHRLRTKSNIRKQFASRLQQEKLLLVWSQNKNSSRQSGVQISQPTLFKGKLKQWPRPSDQAGVMSSEDTEDYLICSAL